MDLEYGNEEIAFKIIEKIVRREGIGDILAKEKGALNEEGFGYM